MKLQQYGLKRNAEGLVSLTKESVFLFEEMEDERNLTSSDLVASFVERTLGLHEKVEEYVYVIATNSRCEAIGISEISHGDEVNSIVSVNCPPPKGSGLVTIQ